MKLQITHALRVTLIAFFLAMSLPLVPWAPIDEVRFAALMTGFAPTLATVSQRGVALYNENLALRTAHAQTIDPVFDGDYDVANLGSLSGVPAQLGGMLFDRNNPDKVFIGGAANTMGAKIYALDVVRDANQHITGFANATIVADANGVAGGIDGGLVYGPDGVIFYTSYPDNYIGQLKPGSTAPDKLISLSALGVASSVGSLFFVPDGMPGKGRLKILSWSGDVWYDATVTPDGAGTFDIQLSGTQFALAATPIAGPEGVVYVKGGNPGFPTDAVLVLSFNLGQIVAYELNANGDLVLSSARTFLTGLTGAEGAAIDPRTNDFLFATFGGGDKVVRVTGFDISNQPAPNYDVITATIESTVLAGNNLTVNYDLNYFASATDKYLYAGFPVSFYIGDPRQSGAIYLDTTSTNDLIERGLSGSFTALLDITGHSLPFELYLVAGDTGTGAAPFNTFAAGHFDHATISLESATSLNKVFSPTSISAGSTAAIIFTISENATDDGVDNTVSFVDTLANGLVVATTPAIANTCTGGTVTANVGSNTITVSNVVLSNGTPSCTISVAVTAATAGNYANGPSNLSNLVGTETSAMSVQTLTTVIVDNDGDNIPDQDDRCPNTPAGGIVGANGCPLATDLSATKTASAAMVTPGTPFDYVITVTNSGAQAHNVTVTDVVPASVTINGTPTATNTAATGGACTVSGQKVTCTWDMMDDGASETITIHVTP